MNKYLKILFLSLFFFTSLLDSIIFSQNKAIDKFRKKKEEKKVSEKKMKEKIKKILEEGIKKNKPKEEIPLEELIVPVIAFRIKRTDFKEVIPIMGTIKPFEEVKLKFEVKGKIKKVYKKEGEEVEEGETLAELEEEDFLLREEFAKNKYIAEKNIYLSMEKEYKLKEKLYKKGAILKEKLEELELKLEAQKYKMKAAESEWKLAHQDLKKIKIISPCKGVLDEKKVEEGEAISPQDEAFTILKVDKVYAEVGITEKDISKVKKGQRAQIKTDAYSGKEFSGIVKNILPSIKGISRTLALKIEIDNEKGMLLPGMFVRGDIILADLKDIYIIPKDALLNLGYLKYGLLIITPTEELIQEKLEREGIKGKVSLKEVGVGYRGERYAQVIGVKEGELVVLQTTQILAPNAWVKIISIEEYQEEGE